MACKLRKVKDREGMFILGGLKAMYACKGDANNDINA